MRLLALLLLAPGLVVAQSMEPRAYSKVHSLLLGYVRSLDLFGKAGSIGLLLPLVDLTGTATLNGSSEARREVSGLGDPGLRLAWNFYGAPALSALNFGDYRQDLIVGTSLTLTAPFGQYDPTRLVNIGTNRWSAKPELGLSKAFDRWTVELAGGVTFFTRNDEFFNGNTRSQDPLYSAQVHATRQFGRGFWGALSVTYYEGGQTSLNGVARDDRIAGSRAAATVALPVDRQNSIKLSAAHGLYARTGGDFTAIGVTWQHLWGGGQSR
jgi:hypothetical protein